MLRKSIHVLPRFPMNRFVLNFSYYNGICVATQVRESIGSKQPDDQPFIKVAWV